MKKFFVATIIAIMAIIVSLSSAFAADDTVYVYARKYQLVAQYYGTDIQPTKKDVKIKTIEGNQKSTHIKTGRFNNRAMAVPYLESSLSNNEAYVTWYEQSFDYEAQEAMDLCVIFFDANLQVCSEEEAIYVSYRFWDAKASKVAIKDMTLCVGGTTFTVAHLFQNVWNEGEWLPVPVYGLIMGKGKTPSKKDPTPTKKPDPTNTPGPDPTNTPGPDPTNTPGPDPTNTPGPDPTPAPTNTPNPQFSEVVDPPFDDVPTVPENKPDPQFSEVVDPVFDSAPVSSFSAPEAPVAEAPVVEAPVVEAPVAPVVEDTTSGEPAPQFSAIDDPFFD